MAELVVLVHGLWMTGAVMHPLRHRLRLAGFEPRAFSYTSFGATPSRNAARLRAFLAGVPGDVVHLVGHSMGGLLLLHLFERHPPARPGRLVFLGTPAQGSMVARALARRPATRWLLGGSTERCLLGGAPEWAGDRDLGVVAGTRPFGVGRLLARIPRPHDGTVALAETSVATAAAFVALPTTHTTMLWSRSVAAEVTNFLRTGHFLGSGAERTSGAEHGRDRGVARGEPDGRGPGG